MAADVTRGRRLVIDHARGRVMLRGDDGFLHEMPTPQPAPPPAKVRPKVTVNVPEAHRTPKGAERVPVVPRGRGEALAAALRSAGVTSARWEVARYGGQERGELSVADTDEARAREVLARMAEGSRR